jgi:multidrug efflux pump subunit AcrA (membrane-fusion protein)
VAATTGTRQQAVSTTGTIEPAQQAVLAFTVPGTVTSVPAAVGQKVAKGSVLATVDRTSLQTTVTTAAAGVTAAEQQLASVAAGTAAQVTAAQAQLAAARSTLSQAQAALAAGYLTAPFSGVVAAVGLSAGDVVGSSGGSARSGSSSGTTSNSSANSSSSTGSITLISTDKWVVNAEVGSADLASLRKGLQATVTPSGGAVVFGTIASVGIVASASSGGTATFPVVVDVTGSPAGLYAGATADVSLIVKQIPNALTVPTAAVQNANGQTVVYRHVGGKRVASPVTLGPRVAIAVGGSVRPEADV